MFDLPVKKCFCKTPTMLILNAFNDFNLDCLFNTYVFFLKQKINIKLEKNHALLFYRLEI